MKIIIFTFAYLLSLSINAVKLTTDEQKSIELEGLVTDTQNVPNETWPRVIIKARIKTPPLSAVAIFAAYDYQKNYIPNLIKSDIHKVVSPNKIQVSYELDMPWPLSNSHYINDHELKSDHPESYKVSWTSVTNTSAKSTKGSATFLSFPGNKKHTLMIYENHIVPNSAFAGLLQGPMIKDTEDSIKSVIKETEKLAAQKSTTLIRYENKILDALQNKNPY